MARVFLERYYLITSAGLLKF